MLILGRRGNNSNFNFRIISIIDFSWYVLLQLDFCLWTHYSPEIEQPTQSDTLLVDCRYSAGSGNNGGSQGALCPSRITGQTSSSGCSITVSQSTNEDTGNWHLTAIGVSPLVCLPRAQNMQVDGFAVPGPGQFAMSVQLQLGPLVKDPLAAAGLRD